MNQPIISPSVLSCNFLEIGRAIEMLNESSADWVHCDIMDGVFVPNITFGMPILQAIKKISQKPLDVHLMIVQPERYLEDFKKAGADILTVHYEASIHLHRTLQTIRQLDMKTGIAINPHTPVNLLFDVLENTDLVCLMSVNPGFGGQTFIENTYKKIETLKKFIIDNQLQTLIEVDGGVNAHNSKKLWNYGADVLVAGNFVFHSENPLQTIQNLKTLNFPS
jgi:ribulose-phosphate 3-epimerase